MGEALPAIVGERAVGGAGVAPAGIEKFPHMVEWILPKNTEIQRQILGGSHLRGMRTPQAAITETWRSADELSSGLSPRLS